MGEEGETTNTQRRTHSRMLTRRQTQKDLPVQLLKSATPLEAKIVLGSFGSSKAIVASIFDIQVVRDANSASTYEAPLRYGKRPEIHHIFRADPKNPPKIISLAFAAAVLAAIPVLFIMACSWCQPQPRRQGSQCGPRFARRLLRLHCGDGGCLLPVLQQLEPFPDSPSHCCRGRGCVPERKQRPGRGAAPPSRGREIEAAGEKKSAGHALAYVRWR
ncbi:oligosaccharyltransferase subunit ribophorin II [Cordyceps javanica]|uniref:Oligosaccharyltransferase subunit ribophorin II n=1 Tax=Cordyceps javanica TaxID=43265 RepID=A0A545V403_9HYPO|nr:oligosaccharyltransferase subunit ribophorin II [Cordyceps javanica]